jgi:hypothetical protein
MGELGKQLGQPSGRSLTVLASPGGGNAAEEGFARAV